MKNTLAAFLFMMMLAPVFGASYSELWNSSAQLEDASMAVSGGLGPSDSYATAFSRNMGSDYFFTVDLFSSDGTLSWEYNSTASTGNKYPKAVAVSGSEVIVAIEDQTSWPYDYSLYVISAGSLSQTVPNARASSMAADTSGNIYTAFVTDWPDYDAVLTKYGSSYSFSWNATFNSNINGAPNLQPVVSLDSSENVLLAVSSGSDYYEKISLVKYSPSGSLTWSNSAFGYEGEYDTFACSPYGISERFGTIFVAGKCSQSGENIIARIAYDSDGTMLANATADWSNDDHVYSMAVDSYGRTFVAGDIRNSSGFQQSAVNVYSESMSLLYSARRNAAYDESYFSAISADSEDNALVSGYKYDGTYSHAETVKYSFPVPIIALDRPLNNSYHLNTSVRLNITPRGDVDAIKYSINGGSNITFTENTTLSLSRGNTYTVVVYANTTEGEIAAETAIVHVLGSFYDDSLFARFNLSDSAGHYSRGIAIDSEGNTIVTELAADGQNNGNSTLIKYDLNGNMLWSRHLTGYLPEGILQFFFGGIPLGPAVAVDSADNIIVAGVSSTVGSYSADASILVTKFDSDGDELWSFTKFDSIEMSAPSNRVLRLASSERIVKLMDSYDYASLSALGVAIDLRDDSIIVSGTGATTTDGLSFITNSRHGYGKLVKYASDGNEVWDRSFRFLNATAAADVAVDSNGNVFAVGAAAFINTTDMDNAYASADAFMVKYDSDGNQIVNATFSEGQMSGALSCGADSKGNLVVGMVTDADFNFDINAIGDGEDFNFLSKGNLSVMKYNSNLALMWRRDYAHQSSYTNFPSDLVILPNDAVAVSGYKDYHSADNDAFIFVYDNSGNLYTRAFYNSDTSEGITGIAYFNSTHIRAFGYSTFGEDFKSAFIYDQNVSMPGFAVVSPVNRTYMQPVPLEVLSTFAITGWKYSIDGAANVTFTPNTTLSVSEGSHSITVYAQHSGSWLSASTPFIYTPEHIIANITSGGFDAYSRGVATDVSGNIIATGYTFNETGDGTNLAFLRKYSSSGTLLWNRTLPVFDEILNNLFGAIYLAPAVAVDGDGDIIISGKTPDNQMITTKFSAAGAELWSVNFTGETCACEWLWENIDPVCGENYQQLCSPADTAGTGVSAASDGSIFVSGYVGTFGDWSNVHSLLVKYDGNGAQLWNRTYGNTTESNLFTVASDVATDSEGNSFLTGAKAMVYSGYDLETASSDAFIAKFASDGTLLIEESYSNGQMDGAIAVATDDLGNAYVAAFSGGTILENTMPLAVGNADMTLIKYNGALAKQWEKYYEHSGTYSNVPGDVAVNSDGFALMTGYKDYYSSDTDGITLMYSGSGVLSWSRAFNAGYAEGLTGIAFINSTSVAVAGYSDYGESKFQFNLVQYEPDFPLFWITSPENRVYGSPSIWLNVSARVPVSSWRYSLDSGSYSAFAPNQSLTFAEGAHSISVEATLSNGSVVTESVSFTVRSNQCSGTPLITIGNSGSNYVSRSVAVDGNGNIILTGYLEVEKNPFDESVTPFLAKYSSDGTELWSINLDNFKLDPVLKYFFGTIMLAPDVAVDSSNSIIVTGTTMSGGYVVTEKYSEEGAIMAAANYTGEDCSSGTGMALDIVSGVIYVAAACSSSNCAELIVYDSSLNLLGNASYSAGLDMTVPSTIAADSSGNVYMSGTFVYIDYGVQENIYTNTFIAKFDPSQTLVAEKTFSNGKMDAAFASAIAADGGLILATITGGTFSNTDLPFNTTNTDINVTKYDGSLDPVWSASYEHTTGYANVPSKMLVDANGNAIVGGYSEYFSPDDDGTVLEYNSSGELAWSGACDTGNLEGITGIAFANSTSLITLGYSDLGGSDLSIIAYGINLPQAQSGEEEEPIDGGGIGEIIVSSPELSGLFIGMMLIIACAVVLRKEYA